MQNIADDDFSLKNGFSYMRRSRVAAIQLLYQIEFYKAEKPLAKIIDELYELYEAEYKADNPEKIINKELIEALASVAIEKKSDIFDTLKPLLKDSWTIEELPLNLSFIFRIAIAEILSTKTDLPIILNEYIDIAKAFESPGEAKFVNSVLEQVGKQVRK